MTDPSPHSVEAEVQEWHERHITSFIGDWSELTRTQKECVVEAYTAARNAGLEAAAKELIRAAQFDRSTWRVGRQLLNDGRDWERFLADSIRALKGGT